MRGALSLLVACALLACSGSTTGGGGPAGASGLPGNLLLSQLNDAQLAQLCDWSAAKEGGYGATESCDGGITVHAKASQQDCVTSSRTETAKATCTATVSDAETCINALASDPCDIGTPACAPLISCAGA